MPIEELEAACVLCGAKVFKAIGGSLDGGEFCPNPVCDARPPREQCYAKHGPGATYALDPFGATQCGYS